MNYFAQLTLPEFTGFLVIVAGMLTGFYALIKSMQNQATKDREADRAERKALTDSFIRVAEATERQASEAEQRNGHLAEISIQNKDAILKAINKIGWNQEVKEQHVDKQVIGKKEK